MSLTPYHAKYFAHELTKRCASDSVDKLAGAVASAQVDLNPHQVDAALFAFNSPLAKGALLADEVGLGKTIEAGLVLSQKWAERKRRILIITPSNLRKQWYQEITEKFFLSCRILEAKTYKAAIKVGKFRPFEADEIVICSYQFACGRASDVANTAWDLVVIDEAHRLRNVYKTSNVIANTLKLALANAPKLLLTATPLQNSLLELFGLVSFIDERTFGDLKSFREQFANLSQQQVFETLKARLRPICHRTLRRQVTSYVPFTKRMPLLEYFTPEESEDRLYALVSEYLTRDNLQALPASQRSLMTLVLRKLLASSTFAIAGALTSIANRLRAKLPQQETAEAVSDDLSEDYEALGETAEEWADDPEVMSPHVKAAIEQEIADLESFAQLASSIQHNAKGTGERRAASARRSAFPESLCASAGARGHWRHRRPCTLFRGSQNRRMGNGFPGSSSQQVTQSSWALIMRHRFGGLQGLHGSKGSALAGVGVVHPNTHPRAGDSARPFTRQRHSRTDAEDSTSAASVQAIDFFLSSKPRDLNVTDSKGGKCSRN